MLLNIADGLQATLAQLVRRPALAFVSEVLHLAFVCEEIRLAFDEPVVVYRFIEIWRVCSVRHRFAPIGRQPVSATVWSLRWVFKP